MSFDHFFEINDHFSDVRLYERVIEPRAQIQIFGWPLVNETDCRFSLLEGRYVVPRMGKIQQSEGMESIENMFLDALFLYVDGEEDEFSYVRRDTYILVCERRERLTIIPVQIVLNPMEYKQGLAPICYKK